MRLLIMLLFFKCTSVLSQNILGIESKLDTIKFYSYDGTLGTIAYMNEDTTYTQINYVRKIKVYERKISVQGNDTIFEIKNYHYCNGKIAIEFIQNKRDKITTIEKIYDPSGYALYKGNMDYIKGNGREYFYNYNECELYSVEIKNYKNFLLEGPTIELKSIGGDTMVVYNYKQGKLNGKLKVFRN